MRERDIELNYADARRQANQLRMHAEELQSALTEYRLALETLGGTWAGPEAAQYISAAQRKTRNLERASSRLDELALAIDKTAAVYRRNELQRLSAQRSRG